MVWPMLIAAGIAAAGSVASAKIGADANASAANQASRGYALDQKGQAELQALLNDERQKTWYRYKENRLNARPANDYFRRLIATEGGGLTPGQQQELADVQRGTLASLSASGLGGSGRATTAALQHVDTSTRGRMTQENRARAQNAAQNLSSQGIHAKDVETSSNLANLLQQGNAVGAIGQDQIASGLLNAGSTTANAGIAGQTIGNLSSILSGAIKDYSRESRYGSTA